MSKASHSFSVAQGVEWTDTDGEIVILDVKNGLFFGLDQLSGDIWKHIANRKTVPEIVDSIVAEYEVSLETVQEDVNAFVSTLREKQLIQESPT
jgi:hypothetical protein